MHARKWHDELTAALRQQGLPTFYIRRLTDELAEHLFDTLQENPLMDEATISSRLGTPQHLATEASNSLRQSKFCGRHPLLAFLLLPIPTVVMVLVVWTLALISLADLIPRDWLATHSAATTLSATLFSLSICYVPFIVVSAIFCRAAIRSGCGWRWSLAAALLIAALAGAVVAKVVLPTAEPDSGRFLLALAFPPTWAQLPQFLAPLAVAALVWMRYQKRFLPAATAHQSA